jgi:hypothetical protein
MSESSKSSSAPYASWSSFLNFVGKLRDSGIPSRIDPSVFGNASGSISYSVIAALKSLGLINDDGVPQPNFKELVEASEERRKVIVGDTLRVAYPALWGGEIDLTTATSGQFDEFLRAEYDVRGSTVDKAAAFFLSAAQYADEPISAHLKARKSTAASVARRIPKGKKKIEHVVQEPPKQSISVPQQTKPLEHQLVDLMVEGDIDEEVKESIWKLVQYLTARRAREKPAQ